MIGNYYPQNGGVNWVQGEAGARAWMMTPNSAALLMDSERPCFYWKQTDNYGMPLPLRIFDYKERVQNAQIGSLPSSDGNGQEYVTKAEFDAFKLAIQGGAKHDAE